MAILYLLSFPNGKRYVGIATDLRARLKSHRIAAKNDKGFAVHKAIAAHGWDSVEKLTLAEDEFENIKFAEQFAIAFLKTRPPNGYNLTDGGDGTVGKVLSSEAREAIRQRMKGNKHCVGLKFSKEEIAARKKWNHSEATKQKIRAALKGLERTPEQIETYKASAQARWLKPEQRAHASAIAKERCARPGMKERMQEIGKAIVHTEQQKRKHSQELAQFYAERKAGVHAMKMGEWFAAKRRASA